MQVEVCPRGRCEPPPFFWVRRRQKKNFVQPIQVDWLDAAGEAQHIPPEDAATLQPLLRANVGFLLDEREDAIILCAGVILDQDNQCMGCEGTVVIPRGMIVSTRELGRKDEG